MFAGATGRRPHFRIFDIPVRVEPFFVLIIVFIGFGAWSGWLLGSWILIASVSVLVHELGHAVAFRAYGASPSIVLHGFGGLTSARADLTPAKSVVVSLAGPLATLLPFGLPALIYLRTNPAISDDATEVLTQVVFVNLVWALLNLLPLLPLDGGNVLAALCSWASPTHGRRVAAGISAGVAGIGALLAFSAGFVFLAVFGGFFVAVNVMELSRPAQGQVDPDGAELIGQSFASLAAGQPTVAERLAQEALGRRTAAPLHAIATELVAWARLAGGDVQGAQLALAKLTDTQQPSVPFQASFAMASGSTQQGVALLAWAVANQPEDPMIGLGIRAAVGAGAISDLVRELLLMGPDGPQMVTWIADVLARDGLAAESAAVRSALVGHVPIPPNS